MVLAVQAWLSQVTASVASKSDPNRITVEAWAKAPSKNPARVGPQTPGARPKNEAKPDEPRANPKKEERTRLV